MSHHSVITIASNAAPRVKPPSRAITVTTPATIHTAATIKIAKETVRLCSLLVVCDISASL
jgi:hypothetical protein